jgi:hypothetical protein
MRSRRKGDALFGGRAHLADGGPALGPQPYRILGGRPRHAWWAGFACKEKHLVILPREYVVKSRGDANAPHLGRVGQGDPFEFFVGRGARWPEDRRLEAELAGIDRRLDNATLCCCAGKQDALDPIGLENELDRRVVECRIAGLENKALVDAGRERLDDITALAGVDRLPDEPGGIAPPITLGVVHVNHRQIFGPGLHERLGYPRESRPERRQQRAPILVAERVHNVDYKKSVVH